MPGSARTCAEPSDSFERLCLLAAALEASASAMGITDPLGVILWANPAFTGLTGYAVDEVPGRSARVLKSGLHDSDFYADLWSTVAAGRVWHGEPVNRRKDGSQYPEEMTITSVRSATGHFTPFVAVKSDIAQRRAAQSALQRERILLRTAIGHLP